MTEDGTKARGFIATVIAAGIVLLAIALFVWTPTPTSLSVLTGLLSALTLALGQIIQFYFGSSSGAKVLVAAQSEAVKSLTEAVSTSVPAAAAGALGGSGAATPSGTPSDPVSVTEVPAVPDPAFLSFKGAVRQREPTASDERVASAWEAWKAWDQK